VFQGIHSVDVSLIIAPVLHEFIKDIGDATGIEYDEGISDEKERAVIRYQRNVSRAKEMMKKLDIDVEETLSEKDTPDSMEDQMGVMIVAAKEAEPTEEPEKEMMEEPKGLMSRSVM